MRTRREKKLVSESERRQPQVVRVGTHSSGLELDLNVSRVNTFIEDRKRKLVFGFVKFVSGSGTSKHLWIKWPLVNTDLGVGIVFGGDLGD